MPNEDTADTKGDMTFRVIFGGETAFNRAEDAENAPGGRRVIQRWPLMLVIWVHCDLRLKVLCVLGD